MTHYIEIDANGLRWKTYNTYERRDIDSKEIKLCEHFLKQCQRTKTGRMYSYSLKHVIEKAMDHYVSNGACLQAASNLGLVIKPCFQGFSLILSMAGAEDRGKFTDDFPLNAWIGVSTASVRALAHRLAAERESHTVVSELTTGPV